MRALAERKLVEEQSSYRADILCVKCKAFIRDNPTFEDSSEQTECANKANFLRKSASKIFCKSKRKTLEASLSVKNCEIE